MQSKLLASSSRWGNVPRVQTYPIMRKYHEIWELSRDMVISGFPPSGSDIHNILMRAVTIFGWPWLFWREVSQYLVSILLFTPWVTTFILVRKIWLTLTFSDEQDTFVAWSSSYSNEKVKRDLVDPGFFQRQVSRDLAYLMTFRPGFGHIL